MTALYVRRFGWTGSRNKEGIREFKLTSLIETDSVNDGPQTVMNSPGLAVVGSVWQPGNDLDLFVFCTPGMRVSVHDERPGEPNTYWRVEQIFSSKPMEECEDELEDDPLLKPQKVSGNFAKYMQEVSRDRHGELIVSSSHEQLRGSQVEFDHNRPAVRIEQNVAALELATFSSMIDTVNDEPLWGLDARCIKLSNVSWERRRYATCTFYYTRVLDFDVDFNDFDRDLLDEGTKVLNGHWDEDTGLWVLDDIGGEAPDKTNAQHFMRAIDRAGNIVDRVVLDGNGEPISASAGTGTEAGSAGQIPVEYYPESNFLLLGIPTTF